MLKNFCLLQGKLLMRWRKKVMHLPQDYPWTRPDWDEFEKLNIAELAELLKVSLEAIDPLFPTSELERCNHEPLGVEDWEITRYVATIKDPQVALLHGKIYEAIFGSKAVMDEWMVFTEEVHAAVQEWMLQQEGESCR